MIIIGYQGIGKTTLSKSDARYIDLESSMFRVDGKRPDGWEILYCKVAADISRQGYSVFISSHKEVRDYLRRNCDEPYCAVIPALNLESQWIDKLKQRYIKSGSSKDYRAYVNALSGYSGDIPEIEADVENIIEIEDMNYSLSNLIGAWCNGSTRDFDSRGPGSKPGASAK